VFKTFWAFLLALFVLSTGLACIETAANPYVTVLGPKDGAAGRLSTAQAFNSVAYIIAPTVGGMFIFGQQQEAGAPAEFHSLIIPYVVLGCVVLLVFAIFSLIKLPDIDDGGKVEDADDASVHKAPLFRQPHFTFGIVTQFLYIAAQVGVNAFAVNYISKTPSPRTPPERPSPLRSSRGTDPSPRGPPEATAAYVITIAMVLYAIGRFSARAHHSDHQPNLLLSLYASSTPLSFCW